MEDQDLYIAYGYIYFALGIVAGACITLAVLLLTQTKKKKFKARKKPFVVRAFGWLMYYFIIHFGTKSKQLEKPGSGYRRKIVPFNPRYPDEE